LKLGKVLLTYNFNTWKFLENTKHIQEGTRKIYYPDKAVIESVKPPVIIYQIFITSKEWVDNIGSIYDNYKEQNEIIVSSSIGLPLKSIRSDPNFDK